MDVAKFRLAFPVFADETIYTAEMVELWQDMATSYLKQSWALSGKVYEHAMSLMTAHLLFIANKSASGNNSSGAVQSATEGSVSVSFAAPPTQNGWQFWLSSTPYGIQLWALLKSIGGSGFYIGGLPERKAVRKVGGVFL